MRILPFIALLVLLSMARPLCAEDSATNAPPPSSDKLPTADDLLASANADVSTGLLDSAISETTLSIQLNPKNSAAYELRGSVYVTKKDWDRAERDYTAADKISPDVAYKFKVGEIHYLKRDYDGARPRFAALKDDDRLGDLSIYKVFLCDMLGSHEDQAKRDIAAMDLKNKPPSLIYAQIAWDLYHGRRNDADVLIAATVKAFPEGTGDLYLGSLTNAQRFRPGNATFVTKDGTKYANVHVLIETSGLRISTSKDWITVPIDQLPDDLSCFTDDDMRDQIAQRRSAAVSKAEMRQTTTVSFTTRSGTVYRDARWFVEDNGLSVLGPNGWIVVPFSDLPADISSFPPEAQEKLGAKLVRAQFKTASTVEHVTFTSKRGRTFESVRATLTDEGVRVLSNDGWMMVSARDLPDDLSPFPEGWRSQLQDQKRIPDINHTTEVLSFITRSGKRYDEARCTLESRGVRVLGPDGLVCVTWKELPDDISIFPADWRRQIIDGKKAPIKTNWR